MGYYRRYLAIYLSVALAAGLLWAAAELVWDLPLLFSLPFFVLVVFLAAIFCSAAGMRRYQKMNLRLLQTGDTRAFLQEISACEKAANRNTRNTILISKAYAYLLAGRWDAASALLSGLDLASCRQPLSRIHILQPGARLLGTGRRQRSSCGDAGLSGRRGRRRALCRLPRRGKPGQRRGAALGRLCAGRGGQL